MGIKSFQGKQVGELPLEAEKVYVKDVMNTKPISFTEDMRLIDAMKIIITNKISGGPVINSNKEVVGVLSEGDCIKQISDSRYYNMPMENLSVGKNMSRQVETIDSEMNIFDAANKFLTLRRRRFPVVQYGKLIGMVSQKDILITALKLTGNNWSK
ncbi:MAG: CBS domain-containing protein [Bacteroidota bacterium]